MNDYTYYPEDRIPFTKTSPRCPKCGGKTKRTYRVGQDVYGRYWSSEWIGVEFLNVYCQDCGYEYPQYVETPQKEQSK